MTVAFLFPGQGSQFVGMMADIRAQEPSFRARMQEASDALDLNLDRIVAEGPDDRLAATAIAQPALLASSVALYEVWAERAGHAPALAAGHSLGEYSALTAGGVFKFADAVRLVHERGVAMQAAVSEGQGLMAAILGLELDAIAEVCEATKGVVSPANLNAPGQVVISGETRAVERAIDGCKNAGAKRTFPLNVSVPSHCALMAPAVPRIARVLESLPMQAARFPIYHNLDATISLNVEGIRTRLRDQLVSPVRWSESVGAMLQAGVTKFVECGPGTVLSGLSRRINRRVPVVSMGSASGLASVVEEHA